MKTKTFGKLLFGLVLLIGLTGPGWSVSYPTATAPATGDGSSGNPYQIANLENLYWIAAPEAVVASPTQATRWAAHYIQTANIDASDTDGGTGWGTAGWSPIGNSTTKFTGSYDGDGYIIDGLFISRSATNYQGLFGYTDGATISNMGIANLDITGLDNVGGLVGYSNNSAISTCYTSGTIVGNPSGMAYTAGLVGYVNSGSVSNSYATCSVTASGRYALLVGQVIGGTIEYSYSTGRIGGSGGLGLIGYQSTATITNCFWDMEASYYTTQPSGSFGGGTGKNTAEMMQQNTFTGWDFTATWNIYSNGESYPYLRKMQTPPSLLSTSVSGGDVNLSWGAPSPAPNGYNVYRNAEKINASLVTSLTYNDTEATIGTNYNYYIEAVYTTGLSQPSNFTPYLDLRFTAGTGKSGAPYQITTHSHLNYIGDHLGYPYVSFKLMNALDLTSECASGGTYYNSGAGWEPIGTSGTGNQFQGGFDGNGYVITGLMINRASTSDIGLFGEVKSASFSNVKLEQVNVTGNDDVGGLVGYNGTSPINNSYVTGVVNGSGAVGGLVGYSQNSAISNSYTTGEVTASAWAAGGLVGYSYADTITDAYSEMTINGNNGVGGLFGESDNSVISTSHATGSVTSPAGYGGGFVGYSSSNTFTNCYADGNVESSGQYAGGFAGYFSNDDVNNCDANGDVTGMTSGNSYAGGLAGYSYQTTVSNASADGKVTGDIWVGGLVGFSRLGSIEYSSATDTVDGGEMLIGGLVGEAEGTAISNSYASGIVTGNTGTPPSGHYYTDVGGLVGYADVYSGTVTAITNSYACGSVTSEEEVGGLVGYLTSTCTINNSYAVGVVTGNTNVGGLVGTNGSTDNSNVTNSFWDTQHTGQASSDGGTGKTTAEMKSVATFTDESTAGLTTAWDFETDPNDDAANEDYWDMDLSGTINGGYPFLSYQNGTDCSLPVELAAFTAKVTDKGDVLLQWITESEIENLGFNLYRSASETGDYQRVNSALIPGAGSSPDRHTYNYTDKKPGPGHVLWYQLEDVDFTGKTTRHEAISTAPVVNARPEAFRLYPNYPNPFNPVTRFTYEIPATREVHIAIYKITGAKVCDLFNGKQAPGAYTLRWDGTNAGGQALPSGIYFVVIQAGRDYDKFKMTLLR
ncbi:MAG: T9SS type A sorting domain-containing protein [Candidatus Marinimicrobia bacterium]|nr:T9SS type A sorting domain-containing protein [Candidatus Neomarinimicrobiota bacterium]MCF7828108.1 T9SS type A sorting domain-containing protein [Candidatus Neomarinimicrobiota bacterium]MCF7879717.1 T9SS type A sorting domain-containing protein [Candidatus Neomarinimicrobiota bacterium]